ncbi:uncharacterized protein [Palaemon carinicauda]|uniref:uncharacterized protein n=1 Tax=Palaemon carinicauda TaxID=392227 RepID=UPI0035B5A1BC
MFQTALILAAISAAFTSGFPPPIPPCQIITYELQRAFRPKDPQTFPIISDFDYTRNHITITFDFFNLTLKGFSNVSCNSFNVSGQNVATLNLKGLNLDFNTGDAYIHINQPGSDNSIKPKFTSQLRFYTLDLMFKYDSYIPDPLSLCITRDSLEMTFSADIILTNVGNSTEVTQELNDHPEAVVRAINNYLPRFASNLTATLNERLCLS